MRDREGGRRRERDGESGGRERRRGREGRLRFIN